MGLVAPIRATDVDKIDINFRDDLYNVTFSLYGQEIHSVWLQGIIKRLIIL